jgi:hypothetical protein
LAGQIAAMARRACIDRGAPERFSDCATCAVTCS